MSGTFLEDGIKDAEDQIAKDQRIAKEMRAKGMTKIRVLETFNGNKFVTKWVKKDEATLKFEAEQDRKDQLKKRAREVERKSKMLDMLKKEQELGEREKELEAMEKELLKEAKKSNK